MLLDGADTTALIERLNELALTREQELQSLAASKAKLEERRQKLEARYERDKKLVLDELGARSREIFREWQSGKMAAKQAMRELHQAKERAQAEAKIEAEAGVDPDSLRKDALVLYVPWNKKGRVDEVDAKKRQVRIDLQGVRLWAKPEDLRLVAQAAPATTSAVSVVSSGRAALRLDLRGYRADVALSELASFLDKALLGNADEVEILHGRGSGALRREVHQFLAEFPAVASYALASEEQGGDGMTLVTLV
jgi:DNA mismatch repair protein MutS2